MTARLWTHLWTGGPQPIEMLRYRMCRYIYHCTPIELDAVPIGRIMTDMLCANVEAQADEDRRRLRG